VYWTTLLCATLSHATENVAELQRDSLGHLFFTLFAFVVFLLLAAWFLKKLGVPQRLQGNLPFKIIGTMPLSPRDKLMILEYEQEWWILSMSSQGVSLLKTVPKGDLSSTMATSTATLPQVTAQVQHQFKHLLAQYREKFKQ
jgi:flagellar biosynthetic protein FliO